MNLQKCEDSERTESRKPGKQTKGGFDLARQKDENREKAKQLFLDSDGLMKNTEMFFVQKVYWQEIQELKNVKNMVEKEPEKNSSSQKDNIYQYLYKRACENKVFASSFV